MYTFKRLVEKRLKLKDLIRKILVEHTDPNTGFPEIILLGYCDNKTASEHLSRYIAASRLVHGTVLNCASGSCYGTSILRRKNAVNWVISVDINKDVLFFGKKVYNADCVCADAMYLPFRRHVFDFIVSIETLEHFYVKGQNKFIANIKICLKSRGELILSTPNKLYSSPLVSKPLNPYHRNEYYLGPLIVLLRLHRFKIISVMGGKRVTSLELARRTFGSLLKCQLSRFSIPPRLVDKFYHFIFDRSRRKGMVDPDPEIFPCSELKPTSNIVLFQYFLIHAGKRTR